MGAGFVALFSPTGHLQFANRVTRSALAHVCNIEYHPWTRTAHRPWSRWGRRLRRAFRQSWQRQWCQRVAATMESLPKTSSPCSYVCVSRVLSLPTVQSSVNTLQSSVKSCKVGCPILFSSFYAQLSPVFCNKSHTVESESCTSAIIMIVPKLRKFFGERLGSSWLCPTSVLLQLEVIKCSTMGYDLAWCGGTLTHSGTDAQTDVRFPADFKKTRMHLIWGWAGGSWCGRVVL